jgi:RNA polymerase sigma factor (TIGR02999 family)
MDDKATSSEHETREPGKSAPEWSPDIHQQLRQIAERHLYRERQGITFDPTDLVHEAYLSLCNLRMVPNDEHHFLNLVSTAMRRILVDHARRNASQKRGSSPVRVTLSHVDLQVADRGPQILELDQLLNQLHAADERKAKIAEMHYFGGLTQNEVAAALGLSESTVVRQLRFIRSWLHARLQLDSEQA